MECSLCGGYVEWKGPLSNLTHTECHGCGAVNSQTPEDEECRCQNTKMKIVSFIHHEDGQRVVSVELPGGTGFDAYDDGSIIPWDGNGAFAVCEATRNLHCFAPIGEVLFALTRAEKQLHVELDYACVIPA